MAAVNVKLLLPPGRAGGPPMGGYDVAVLTHADDRVVAAISNIEIRAVIQGRIARPVDASSVSLNGRKIDWQFQRRRADAVNRARTKDLVRGGSEDCEISDGNCVVERLADKQLPCRPRGRRIGVHEDTEPGLDHIVWSIPVPAEADLGLPSAGDDFPPGRQGPGCMQYSDAMLP